MIALSYAIGICLMILFDLLGVNPWHGVLIFILGAFLGIALRR